MKTDITFIKVMGKKVVVEVKDNRGRQQSYSEIFCLSERDAEDRADAMAITHKAAKQITEREQAEKEPRKRRPAQKPTGKKLTPEQLTAMLFKK